MFKSSMKIALLMVSMSLTACSMMPSFTTSSTGKRTYAPSTQQQGTFVNSSGNIVAVAAVRDAGQPLGGNSMDVLDKSKLYHALDMPVGKSTTWTNANTGIDYTVVTTQKVTIDGNSLCRKYNINAVKGDKSRQTTGTACISTDGNWHPVD